MKKEYKEMLLKCSDEIDYPTDILLKQVRGFGDRVKLVFTYMKGFNKNPINLTDTITSSMGSVYVYYLVFKKRTLLGSFCIKKINNTITELSSFTILPKYRNQGYAQKSIKGIQKICKEQGTCLKVKVKSKNIVAINLYKRCGFY